MVGSDCFIAFVCGMLDGSSVSFLPQNCSVISMMQHSSMIASHAEF